MNTHTRYLKLILLVLVFSFSKAMLAQNQSASSEKDTTVHTGSVGTPNSVPDQINSDAKKKATLLDWKKSVLKKTGFIWGADYVPLLQQISDSENGPTNAASGIFRVFGHWTPSKKSGPDAGKIVFKVDNRHRIGTDITTAAIAPLAGVATTTGGVWNDKGWQLTNLYWTQGFGDNAFAYRVGIVDATEYMDVSALMNLYEEFSNLAFSFSPTVPIPSQGLGALARYKTKSNFFVMAGLIDANATPERPQDVFSNFGQGEYLSHISIGWVGSFAERFTENVQLGYWYQNKNVNPDDPNEKGGWGIHLNVDKKFGMWQTFVKASYSDIPGTLNDRSISLGTGKSFANRPHDYAGAAINWARAPGIDRNQYMLEVYYRTQVIPGLAVGPHYHYYINPAFDATKANLWMLGLKLRAAI